MEMEVDKGPDCSENSPCGSSATDAVACPADSSEVAESSGHDEPHGCIASKELSGQAVSDYQEMKEDCQDDLMDAQAAAALECSRVAVEEADSTVGLEPVRLNRASFAALPTSEVTLDVGEVAT